MNMENRDKFSRLVELVSMAKMSPVVLHTIKHILETEPWIVNYKYANGHTVLMVACEHSSIECVELLINFGANINSQDIDGFTALMQKKSSNNARLILINAGADINLQSKNGNNMLMCAIMRCESMHYLKLLIKLGADVNLKNSEG